MSNPDNIMKKDVSSAVLNTIKRFNPELYKAIKSSKDDKFAKVMKEFKEGKLKSSDGKIVTDRKQAEAIAASEAGITKAMEAAGNVLVKQDLEGNNNRKGDKKKKPKGEKLTMDDSEVMRLVKDKNYEYNSKMHKGNKHDFSVKERDKLADEGEAMPNGSYPIRNKQDLKDAIKSIGRAKDPASTKRWITRRAKALGMTEYLPESWTK